MPNKFTAAATVAHTRGDNHTARRIRAEGAICSALVRECLARGYTVSVFDSEEWTVKRSRNRAAIMAALFTTDEDTIRIRDTAGENKGFFYLVYGNDGYDVISDYAARPECEEIYAAVEATITRQEESLCR